jgi:DNA polymerase-3 subunit alpha/error-prone DNA polymerase
MLAYLISRKHVPTKGTMYFGTWIDAEGEFFDTAHFADSLQKYPFRAELFVIGKCRVDYHFPTTITISKMAKMPFIPDPILILQTDNTKRINKLKKM